MKKITLLFTLFLFIQNVNSQTFAWETATDNGATVSETVSGITATVSAITSGINFTDATGFPITGVSNNVVFTENANQNTSVTISFSAAVSLGSIKAFDSELSGLSTWTFTPTGGTNTAVTASISGTSTATVVLNWTGVTSVEVTSSEGLDSFGFDDVVLGATTAAPTVSTINATPLKFDAATLYGNATADGGSTITERGFVYSLTSVDATPTVGESSGVNVTKVIVSGTTGEFNQAISGLTASTGYSFAAYAINGVGTQEGLIKMFSTIASINECTVTNGFDNSNFIAQENKYGQSFIACETGIIQSVALLVTEGETRTGQTIDLYSGAIVTGANLLGSVTGQEFTENGGSATSFDVTDFSGLNISLTAGQTYTFNIPTDAHLIYSTNNGYPNGYIYVNGTANGGNFDLIFNVVIEDSTPDFTWTGATNNDWNTASNWNPTTIPPATAEITIPNGLTNYPTASNAVTFNSLAINSGASFIAQNTVTGSVTYTRNLPTSNWHLVAAPVTGETIEDIIANNTLATGTVGGNIGLAPYDNTQALPADRWDYQTNASTGSMNSAQGFSMKLTAANNVSFTGTINTANVTRTVSTSGPGNNFNLIGNPYTSYFNAGSGGFLQDNNARLSSQTLYVWNQATDTYETKVTADNYKIAPAQGFFVEVQSSGIVTFIQVDQEHSTTDTFQKETKSEFKLSISDGTNNRFAKVYYIENTTTGFDNGFDGKLFGGVVDSFEVYTHLLSNNQGEKYQIQSLPTKGLESMIIPIGLKAVANQEITFSVEAKNLQNGINVYLEDRLLNTFTRLDEANSNYKVMLENASNGTGRFYLHTASKVLSSASEILNSVSIYKTNNNTLRIAGLQEGKTFVRIFTVLGKQVLTETFSVNGVKEISLPTLASGIYIVQLQNEDGKLSKKIIIE